MLRSAAPSVFLATTQPEVCRAFYETTLGLSFRSEDSYALVFDMFGCELRISKVDIFTPHPFTVLDWQVSDIGPMLSKLIDKGVMAKRYDFMEQDEDGIWTVPGDGTRIAWFDDPDGNILSVSQRS